MIIKLKRIWIPTLNCLEAPYEGYLDEKRIGILYCNPVTKELTPESRKFLADSGYTDITIKFE